MKKLYPRNKKLKLLEFDLKSYSYCLRKPYNKFKKEFINIYQNHFLDISTSLKDNIDFDSVKKANLNYEHYLYSIDFYRNINDFEFMENIYFLKKHYHNDLKKVRVKLTKRMFDNFSNWENQSFNLFAKLEMNSRANLGEIQNMKSLYFKNLQHIKRLRIFYGFISFAEIKRLALKSQKKREGAFSFFFQKLESRIDVILYRLNLFETIYDAQNFIYNGFMYIQSRNDNYERRKILYPSYALHPTDMFQIDKDLRIFFYKKFIKRYNSGYQIISLPSYIEVNFKLFSGIFNFRLFNIDNIPYYFEVDPEIFYILYINKLR